MKLSHRFSFIEPSQTLRVTAKAAALRAAGKDVISFGAGEPDFDTPVHIREAAKRAIDAGATRYTAVEGTKELRSAVAAWFAKAHGMEVSPSEVLVTSGAKQAIFCALHALLDAGDEVLIPAPYWVSYTEIAKLAGGVPVTVPCRPENDFRLDAADVAAKLTPRSRVLMLGSPCNPTGAVLDEATVKALARLAVERDLVILTDDIYRTLVYGTARFSQPAALGADVRARTVIVDGVSKAYAMTGWRIGFALAPPPVVEAMATLMGQATTHAASVSQAAALAAVTGPVDDLERMRAEFDRRRLAMLRGLRAIPRVTCVEPQGAFYAFPDVSAYLGPATGIADDVALAERLLDSAQVAVVPGSAFGAPGYIRLSYATSLDLVERGVARIAQALAAL